MIKGKLYKNRKGMMLNITGDVSEIQLSDKTIMLIEVSENGRKLTMKPWDDVKL